MLPACGGDDEGDATTAETVQTQTARPPVTTPPPETKQPRTQRDSVAKPPTVPEEELQGDEEPIRSEAVFTGKGGRLRPRVVQVPAFIAVRVILRGTDASRGQGYTLTIGGHRLAVGHESALDEVNLPGLRPNKAYEGKSPQGDVRVVASAEPGP